LGSLKWNLNSEIGFDTYAVGKSALYGITIRLAQKLRLKSIGFFANSPGWMKTNVVKCQRLLVKQFAILHKR